MKRSMFARPVSVWCTLGEAKGELRVELTSGVALVNYCQRVSSWRPVSEAEIGRCTRGVRTDRPRVDPANRHEGGPGQCPKCASLAQWRLTLEWGVFKKEPKPRWSRSWGPWCSRSRITRCCGWQPCDNVDRSPSLRAI